MGDEPAVAYAALAIAIVAMTIAIAQALQQYFITGALIRLCDSVVFGGLPGQGERVWQTSQFRFRVVYKIPQYALRPDLWPSSALPSFAKADGSCLNISRDLKRISSSKPDSIRWKSGRMPPSLQNLSNQKLYSSSTAHSSGSDVVKCHVGEASWASFWRAVSPSCHADMIFCFAYGDADRCPSDLPTVPMQVSLRDVTMMALSVGMECTSASFELGLVSMQGAAGSITSSKHPILGPLIHFAPRDTGLADSTPITTEGHLLQSWVWRVMDNCIVAEKHYNQRLRRAVEQDCGTFRHNYRSQKDARGITVFERLGSRSRATNMERPNRYRRQRRPRRARTPSPSSTTPTLVVQRIAKDGAWNMIDCAVPSLSTCMSYRPPIRDEQARPDFIAFKSYEKKDELTLLENARRRRRGRPNYDDDRPSILYDTQHAYPYRRQTQRSSSLSDWRRSRSRSPLPPPAPPLRSLSLDRSSSRDGASQIRGAAPQIWTFDRKDVSLELLKIARIGCQHYTNKPIIVLDEGITYSRHVDLIAMTRMLRRIRGHSPSRVPESAAEAEIEQTAPHTDGFIHRQQAHNETLPDNGRSERSKERDTARGRSRGRRREKLPQPKDDPLDVTGYPTNVVIQEPLSDTTLARDLTPSAQTDDGQNLQHTAPEVKWNPQRLRGTSNGEKTENAHIGKLSQSRPDVGEEHNTRRQEETPGIGDEDAISHAKAGALSEQNVQHSTEEMNEQRQETHDSDNYLRARRNNAPVLEGRMGFAARLNARRELQDDFAQLSVQKGAVNWFWLSQTDIIPGFWATPWRSFESLNLQACIGAVTILLEAIAKLIGNHGLRFLAYSTLPRCNTVTETVKWLRAGRSTYPAYAHNARGGIVCAGTYVSSAHPQFARRIPVLELVNSYTQQVDRAPQTSQAACEMRLVELMRLDAWLSIVGRTSEISDGNSGLLVQTPALVQHLMDNFELEFLSVDLSSLDGGAQTNKDIADMVLDELNKLALNDAEALFALVAALRAVKVGQCVLMGSDTGMLAEMLEKDVQVYLV